MTQDKIVYNIASSLKRSDDMGFIRRLRFQVDYYRETLFLQDWRRGRKLLKALLQVIPYIPTKLVDISELGIYDLDKKIVRTKNKLPKIVNLDAGYAVKYIGTVDYSREFSIVDVNTFKYIQYSRYSSKAPIAFFLDDYLYIANAYPDAIAIEAMFSSPTSLGDWFSVKGEQLFKKEDDYPITNQLIQRITQSIISVELQIVQDDSDFKSNQANLPKEERAV